MAERLPIYRTPPEGVVPNTDAYGNPTGSMSPLSDAGKANLGFMDRFRLKTTMDGSKSRRRGPKQNDTPASNHRQQLNRNAQRTHRERKEIYVKDLEKRVSDYKAMIIDMDAHHSATQKELEKIMEENRTLKELLSVHHNIHFHDGRNGTRPSSNGADASVLELTFQGHTPPARMGPTGDNSMYRGPEQTLAGHMGMTTVGTFPRPHVGGSGTQVNQVQIGVDFVLDLERSCREHIPLAMKISNAENGPSHGHELMISAPPCSYFVDHPEEDYDACKWGVQPHELEHMMTLSQVLHDQHGLQTSLKPPLAWRMITRHSRFDEFSASDLRMLKDLLAPQTICYGFGATIEEFQVKWAIDEVLISKTAALTVCPDEYFHLPPGTGPE